MTERDIIKGLERRFKDSGNYMINNVYLFSNKWESDFLLIKQNGEIWEFEIKVSRSDFISDQKNKREKFSLIFSGGKAFPCIFSFYGGSFINGSHFYVLRIREKMPPEERKVFYLPIPDRFFYCAPRGLIKKEEINPLFGLYEVGEEFERNHAFSYGRRAGVAYVTKKAKKLNNRSSIPQKLLLNKFYWKWRNAASELSFYKKFRDCY